ALERFRAVETRDDVLQPHDIEVIAEVAAVVFEILQRHREAVTAVARLDPVEGDNDGAVPQQPAVEMRGREPVPEQPFDGSSHVPALRAVTTRTTGVTARMMWSKQRSNTAESPRTGSAISSGMS